MIKKLSFADEEAFYKLGLLLKKNFTSLYNFEEILSSLYQQVWGYFIENELVGFVHLSISFESVDIVNIVVNPSFRRRGIASILMENILNIYPNCEQLFLEVRVDNLPAINLYNKLGFRKISRRKNYYGDVDALVMERNIKNERC